MNLSQVPISELYDAVRPRGLPGSPANDAEWRAIAIRLVDEVSGSLRSSASTIDCSVDRLRESIAASSEAANSTNDKLVQLNCRLLWLTWLITILTVVLVIFGGVQLWLMYQQSSEITPLIPIAQDGQ